MDWVPTIAGRKGPTYQRIVDALADDIASGRLHQGRRLPTHRALAQALDIDVTTVTRAYAEAARQQLIDARVGRGTFVKAEATNLRRTTAPPAIDLSMILPPRPAGADLEAVLATTLAEIRRRPGFAPYLTYQQAGGSAAERGVAALWLSARMPGLIGSRVVIAPGTQAALMALLLLLSKPGDRVLCENLVYTGLKAAAAAARVTLRGLPLDHEGVVPDALDSACRDSGTKLVVLTPTMHNPTTATMSPRRREQVAEIIAKRGLTLIEDDPYLFLDKSVRPLATLITDRTYLAASLSKSVTPGLRTSLLIAPDAEAAERVAAMLRATTQMPAPLMTAVAVRWLQDGRADALISAVQDETIARQDLARQALGSLHYAAQAASPHVWLPAPPRWSSERFASVLRGRGLGVVASDDFAVAPNAGAAIRLALGAVRSRAELRAALQIVRDAIASAGSDGL